MVEIEDPGERALAGRLEAHVRHLAGRTGERNFSRPEALNKAAYYVEQGFVEAGWPARREDYPTAAGMGRNIVAQQSPLPAGSPFLIIGAHYDTAPGTPGADDNASGVAVLLELARELLASPAALPARLVAFGTEEPPHFGGAEMGSAHHARRAREAGEKVAGMLSLEMLGYFDARPGSQSYPPLLGWFYPPAGDFLALVSDLRSRRLLKAFSAGLRAGGVRLEAAALPRWLPGVSFSDHLSFWREGFPAAMLTDTAFYRNPHYHAPGDLPETLDYGRMARLTRALAATLARWPP